MCIRDRCKPTRIKLLFGTLYESLRDRYGESVNYLQVLSSPLKLHVCVPRPGLYKVNSLSDGLVKCL